MRNERVAFQGAHDDELRALMSLPEADEPAAYAVFAHCFTCSKARGEAEVTLGGRSFILSRDFVDDLATHKVERTLSELGRPLMVFHSPVDRTVGIENAALIYKAARHPKSFVSLDDADHLLLEEADSLYVGTVLGAWATRYVEDIG